MPNFVIFEKNSVLCKFMVFENTHLIDAIPKGSQYDYSLPAVQGLVYVDKLFEMERKIHMQKGVSFDAVKDIRIDTFTYAAGNVLHALAFFQQCTVINIRDRRYEHKCC